MVQDKRGIEKVYYILKTFVQCWLIYCKPPAIDALFSNTIHLRLNSICHFYGKMFSIFHPSPGYGKLQNKKKTLYFLHFCSSSISPIHLHTFAELLFHPQKDPNPPNSALKALPLPPILHPLVSNLPYRNLIICIDFETSFLPQKLFSLVEEVASPMFLRLFV